MAKKEANVASERTGLLAGYITRQELAKELNVTPRTLDKWSWQRKGPQSVRIGKFVYYKRSEVAEWIETLTSEGE